VKGGERGKEKEGEKQRERGERERESKRERQRRACMHTRGHCDGDGGDCGGGGSSDGGPCSVVDGGAKRLSDFVVDPDSSLRRLSLPGFPLLPRTAFRLTPLPLPRWPRYAANVP